MATPLPLTSALLVSLGGTAYEVLAERGDLEEELQALLAEARARWPSVVVDDERAIAYIAERIPEDIDGSWSFACLRTSALYLACAATAGDSNAIKAFEARYSGDLDAAITRLGAPRHLAEEVKQDLLVRLFVGSPERPPRIADYGGRAELYSWVRVAAVRMTINLLRRRGREQTLDDAVVDQLEILDDANIRIKQEYRAQFKAAVAVALANLATRQRNLLRHVVLDRLSIDQIGQLYGVHRATAARWLQRARQKLGADTRAELRCRLAVDDGELASIFRLIDSQLEASLPRLFARSGE